MKKYTHDLIPVSSYNTLQYWSSYSVELKPTEYFTVVTNTGVECIVVGIGARSVISRREYTDVLNHYPAEVIVKKVQKNGWSKQLYRCLISKHKAKIKSDEYLTPESETLFEEKFKTFLYHNVHLVHQYDIAKEICKSFRFYPSIPSHYDHYMNHNQFFDELWFKRVSLT